MYPGFFVPYFVLEILLGVGGDFIFLWEASFAFRLKLGHFEEFFYIGILCYFRMKRANLYKFPE